MHIRARRAVRSAARATLPSVTDCESFTAMFAQLSPRVFAYARRRCDPATAQDVVSDVFVVAWQRRNQLPLDPLPWLLGVARNTLANRRRDDVRQARLADTVAYLEQVAGPAVSADE